MAEEDALAMLATYDTVIVVDDSASMQGQRWADTRAALAALAERASPYDSDGIDIHFLNSQDVGNNISDSQSVLRLFDRVSPKGPTPTGKKLEKLLLAYIAKIEAAQNLDRVSGGGNALEAIKCLNIVVLTDGEPSDDPESIIVTAAKRLDEGRFSQSQVGISFIQIGNDPQATEALRELDDALSGTYGIRDMVDTTLYSGPQDPNAIMKMLLGGVNKKFDRNRKRAAHA